MEIDVTLLPSGGYGYRFPSIRINPMTFSEICKYMSEIPDKDDTLGKFLYDLTWLKKDDSRISDCYLMDVEFLLFYKKLITISDDLSYKCEVICPVCGKPIRKTISFGKDIHFNKVDQKVMNGARIEIGGHVYDIIVPTLRDFMKVFDVYLRYKKVTDINMIKTISLIADFDKQANQVENDVLGATHDDITLLVMLRDLYFNRLSPITLYCPECIGNKNIEEERRGVVTMSVDSLIVDFFRDLLINSPADGTKILFK